MSFPIKSPRKLIEVALPLDPDGPMGERAERLLNRLAGESLPRDADGVNPESLAAMIAARRRPSSPRCTPRCSGSMASDCRTSNAVIRWRASPSL